MVLAHISLDDIRRASVFCFFFLRFAMFSAFMSLQNQGHFCMFLQFSGFLAHFCAPFFLLPRNGLQVAGRRSYKVSGTSYKLLDEDLTRYQERLTSCWTKMLQRIRKSWLTTQATGRYYTPPKPPQNAPPKTPPKTTPKKIPYTKVTTLLPLEERRQQKHPGAWFTARVFCHFFKSLYDDLHVKIMVFAGLAKQSSSFLVTKCGKFHCVLFFVIFHWYLHAFVNARTKKRLFQDA